MIDLEAQLAELENRGLRRRIRVVGTPQGARVLLDGRPVLLLCSNNYLGLADHPRVRRAAADAALHWGAGTGASRLISGTMPAHAALEAALAEFKRCEAALLFGSGYLANTGVIAALAGEGEVVFSDELNHASIIDGCRLARAQTFVYRHRDLDHLAWGLRRAGRHASLIVTDGVFSMDGDIAPLAGLADLAEHYGARLMVDEAHGTGCVGPGGRGAAAAAGVGDRVDVLVGTLGKALGGYGAFVCGSTQLREYLLNSARPFIFSTALPPAVIAAASTAVEVLLEEPRLVERLASNAAELREALERQRLKLGPAGTQIVAVMAGEAKTSTALCERALEGGVFAQAIRPPTVAEGRCRLRLTTMASHQPSDLRAAAAIIGAAARELRIGGTLAAAKQAGDARVAVRRAA